MRHGCLAFILHAHLPFVRHPEHEEFFEEDWLFEAITESYIPLLNMMARLVRDGVPFKLTMSITPPLCTMLQDELLQTRYVRHLDRLIALAQRERDRTRMHAELNDLARYYCELLIQTRRQYVDEWQRDLLARFRHYRDAGVLEIIASAATHGLLPLLAQSAEAVRAQVLIGCECYRETFGTQAAGFWLPECAYSPALETVLQEAEVRWLVLDAHGLMLGKPRPRRAIYAPCFTAAGPAAYARDPESSRQVWSAESGYPGDPAYREFYRDVGFDLPGEHISPTAAAWTPRFTGLKYHRVTGRTEAKQIYNRERAHSVAETHAAHFLESRRQQLDGLGDLDFEPLIVMPFDAELFGHWWYEGPQFLEFVIRKLAAKPDALRLTTPSEYLVANPTQETIAPAASSWGAGGYFGVWLDPSNAWIYPHLHAAAQRMRDVARAHTSRASAEEERVLRQLARELLLAQASDWAFLIKAGTARHYAARRVNDHIARFNKLHAQLTSNTIDPAFLSDCETRDNIFQNVEWRLYA